MKQQRLPPDGSLERPFSSRADLSRHLHRAECSRQERRKVVLVACILAAAGLYCAAALALG